MGSTGTGQRKLAAIMFTDMVGYSAVAQRDETLALELLEEHRELVRTMLRQDDGTEIKTMGDGFLVEFHSALDAARCAINIQRALMQRNLTSTPERQIQVRIGIHVGDVVHRDGDVLGDGVNIASRIEPLAEPGGICVSADVAHQIQQNLQTSVVTMGRAELKNVQVPVEVCRIVLPWEKQGTTMFLRRQLPTKRRKLIAATIAFCAIAVALGAAWRAYQRFGASKSAASDQRSAAVANVREQKSIAVLPFVNMSADKENEYFSDGVTEEILNALARVPGLRVPARTSSFAFKGKNEDIRRIGEQLNVTTVLEGSVRRAGDQLRITAQLIKVADGYHLWSETFDRPARDVFAIQTEVAHQVVDALKLKLFPAQQQQLAGQGTKDIEAYDLYLRGLFHWNKRTALDIQRAIDLFRKAIEKDPSFALAYAGLASAYKISGEYAGKREHETVPKARAAALRALELDSGLAQAHAVLANIKAHYDWRPAEAEQIFLRTIALNPNYASAHQWYGLFLRDNGRLDAALDELNKAKALDPLSAIIDANIGSLYRCRREFGKARLLGLKTVELYPEFPLAHLNLGELAIADKKYPEAIPHFEHVRKLVGPSPYGLGALGHAYARAGRHDDARRVLDELQVHAQSGASVTLDMAFVHLGLGDQDQAFVWMERAGQERHHAFARLRSNPIWDEITSDPRYAGLLKKFGADN